MAANLVTFRAAGIQSCAVPFPPKPDANRRKTSSSPNWWSPLFGWASEPDYIESDPSEHKKESGSESDPESKPLRSRFAPGCFTEEKAKQLRMLTRGSSSFHDVMYHSAIASRLASDFKKRSDLQTSDDR
ncbi:uncharacterized protein LOC110812684 [Carica papaya]|uniref:uncharacterized protein LOC110812684 n=1 Tax=Carica papaya TaxID=3649 RepID=UPI000B8C9019|nr:uncharacterized protein LOC110812684 [Carica papaya]